MLYSLGLRLFALVALACRAAAQSDDQFTTLQSDTNKATSDVKGWDGQITTATVIQSDLDQINNDAKKLKPNTPDYDTFLQGCQSFDPALLSLIKQLISRKADFQSVGLGSTIKNDIVNIKSSIDSMGSTWISKTDSTHKMQTQVCLAKLDNDTNQGISAFS